MSSENQLLVSLGSNCGDRVDNIEKALKWLTGWITSMEHSGIYETESISGDDKMYCNCVVKGLLKGNISDFTRESKQYEIESGRTAGARERGEVPIDVDIVRFGSEILRPKEFQASYFLIGLAKL